MIKVNLLDSVTDRAKGVAAVEQKVANPRTQTMLLALVVFGLLAAGMLFAEGARRAGRTLTRDGLVRALESVKGWESGILPPITIGPDHETQRQGFWVKVDKGRFRQLTDWLKAE